jgi:hypothetical protein
MSTNKPIADLAALMDASMDDIEDLPPMGVPPTGHYNLTVTAERVDPTEAGKNPYIKFGYVVTAVNEVKNEAEAAQAAIGMKFTEMFSPLKKDGTANETGISFLKARVEPFSNHFGLTTMGESIAAINAVDIAATLVRRPDRSDPERFNFTLKDVIVL